ncbi:MAG: hypothetical protein ABSB29_07450 [Nitrososphaerales archaeon]
MLDQATLPVGAEPEPTTTALQVVALPTTTEEREHDTVTLVPGRLLVVNVRAELWPLSIVAGLALMSGVENED